MWVYTVEAQSNSSGHNQYLVYNSVFLQWNDWMDHPMEIKVFADQFLDVTSHGSKSWGLSPLF